MRLKNIYVILTVRSPYQDSFADSLVWNLEALGMRLCILVAEMYEIKVFITYFTRLCVISTSHFFAKSKSVSTS